MSEGQRVRDDTARQIIAEHGGLVHLAIQRWFKISIARHPLIDHDELVVLGQAALVFAWSRFDPGMGTPFSSYAMIVLRRRLARALNEDRTAIPRLHADRNAARVTHEDIENDEELSRCLSGGSEDEMLAHLDLEKKRAWLHWAMQELTPRQRDVILAILSGETCSSIAAKWGISRQAADRFYHQAMFTLRGWAVQDQRVGIV